MAIIGILAAIAIPNLLTAMQRSRQKRTMADMRSIATSIEAYATDTNRYNSAGLSWPAPVVALGSSGYPALLEPTYIKKLPLYDGWSNTFYAGSSTTSYAIRSLGADKNTSGNSANAGGSVTTTNDFDCDIVFADGTFVIYPEGTQSQ